MADKPKVITDCIKAIADEVDVMSQEFDVLRKSGKLDHVLFNTDEWRDFEVANPLPEKLNYTMVPRNFYERLALAALRVAAPCPKCRGTRYGPIAPDFIGDDPEKMKIGTCSVCLFCNGSGVDPNFRLKKHGAVAEWRSVRPLSGGMEVRLFSAPQD